MLETVIEPHTIDLKNTQADTLPNMRTTRMLTINLNFQQGGEAGPGYNQEHFHWTVLLDEEQRKTEILICREEKTVINVYAKRTKMTLVIIAASVLYRSATELLV